MSLAGRALFRSLKRVRLALRPLVTARRIASHLVAYRPREEQATCPACGAAAVEHLAPLALEQGAYSYGFISGCRQCGVLFANPLPTSERLESLYSADGDWGRHRQAEQEKRVSPARLQKLFAAIASELDVLHPPPGASVLDFGCGLGGMLDSFATAGWQTAGIDPATKAAFTRHRELATPPAIAEFDLGVLHHVLEHVTTPLTILRQLAAAVRPGGVLLISVPNLDDLPEHGDFKYVIRSNVHVLAYSSPCLAWLLAETGFRVVSSTRGPGNPRHRIVLARRVDTPPPKPGEPLRAGREALAAYLQAHGHNGGFPWRLLPIRTQAAYLDLKRAEWRPQK